MNIRFTLTIEIALFVLHQVIVPRLVLTETSENRNDYSEMAAADTVVFDDDTTTSIAAVHTYCAII